jgi:hypothetical protein
MKKYDKSEKLVITEKTNRRNQQRLKISGVEIHPEDMEILVIKITEDQITEDQITEDQITKINMQVAFDYYVWSG